ncbi:hypothetical protein ACYCH6_23655, partial [Klebsiella pneumoniae]
MDFTAGLMPLDTALAQMLDRITPLNATETVPLLQAFSRVTAHDIVSPLDVPGFDNAAMDGYAVRLNDLRDGAALPVAGKAFAGPPGEEPRAGGGRVPPKNRPPGGGRGGGGGVGGKTGKTPGRRGG